jgi:hypothetical protein
MAADEPNALKTRLSRKFPGISMSLGTKRSQLAHIAHHQKAPALNVHFINIL